LQVRHYKKIKTMKNSFLTLLIICFFGSIFGQNKLEINFDSIKAKIEYPESDNYYPKLLKRFKEFDTTLTHQDYALIYYGFSFQDDYIKNKPEEFTLKDLVKAEDYEKIIIECQKVLNKNPVSLRANNEMGYSLFKLHKPDSEWKKYQKRYRAIRKVIAYSGHGYSPETAFKVIYVSDEYNMLYKYFDIQKIHQQSLMGLCDKFVVDPSEYYKGNEVYFDISRKLIRKQQIIDNK